METAKTIGIDELLTAPRSPWQNAYVERFIGSARRECLDHVIVFSAYYGATRTHLSLDKDSPIPRPIGPASAGRIVAIPQVGGLHHRYDRAA
jgi:transposase InsO family protein